MATMLTRRDTLAITTARTSPSSLTELVSQPIMALPIAFPVTMPTTAEIAIFAHSIGLIISPTTIILNPEMRRLVMFYSALLLIVAGVMCACWDSVVNYSFRAW